MAVRLHRCRFTDWLVGFAHRAQSEQIAATIRAGKLFEERHSSAATADQRGDS